MGAQTIRVSSAQLLMKKSLSGSRQYKLGGPELFLVRIRFVRAIHALQDACAGSGSEPVLSVMLPLSVVLIFCAKQSTEPAQLT